MKSRRALAVVAQLLLGAALARAETAPPLEYQVKATFLFNFVQFVEWPESAFASADAPLCIGVLGEDPFGTALQEVVRGETIRNRALVIRRSERPEDLKTCQLLFISRSERARVGEILAQLDQEPILTVSEIDGFGRRGGIINFYRESNRVRFEINPAAARRDGLRISSALLSLGTIIESEGGK